MKTRFLLVLILLAKTFYAQDLAGFWQGELDIQGMKLPLVLNISKTKDGYTSTAKSPKQSDKEIAVDKTEFANNQLFFEIKNLGASYKGQFLVDHFEGTFEQRSLSIPLDLYRTTSQKIENFNQEKKIKNLGNRQINTEKIDDYLNYLVKNKQAIGSLCIYRNGKMIYLKNFGQEQLPNTKYDNNTGFQIGSISKLMTATMLMQLEEKQKLNLEEKLSKFYPKVPNADKITLRSMLNHTSGLGDYVGKDYQWLFGKSVGDKVILDSIKATPVEFQPGEKTRYSNSAYYLLSRILEKIYKKPYNVILKENITSKANMQHTFSVLDHPKNIFKSYENENGLWKEMEDFNYNNCIGLGDITSTTQDLSFFINALFNNKLVKKETLEKMLKSDDKPFGLGIMKIPFYDKKFLGHGGDTAGSHSMTSYDKTDDFSIAITINGEKYPHNEIFIGVLNSIYNQDFEYPKFTIEKSIGGRFTIYVGSYASKDIPLEISFFEKDGKLFSQATGQFEFLLEFVENHIFKFEPANIKVTFNPERNEMKLNQNGMEFLFTKK